MLIQKYITQPRDIDGRTSFSSANGGEMKMYFVMAFLILPLGSLQAAVTDPEKDSALRQSDSILPDLSQGGVGKIVFNAKTGRLEVWNDAGVFLEEIAPGTAGRAVDVAGQEYRLSFGKDDMGRKSVLVRAGPAMRKPITVDVFGRKAVLSPDASLLATFASDRQVIYEPSICGQVYYIENAGGVGSPVSRLANSKREVAVLAKPSSPVGSGSADVMLDQEGSKSMEKAGDAVKSVFCAVLGLPDKEPSTKAKVYRLRNNKGDADRATDAAPIGQ